MAFVAANEQALAFDIESEHVFHHPFAGGQLADLDFFAVCAPACGLLFVSVLRRIQVKQIKVVVTVALALVDEFGTVPWQKE